MQKAPHRLFEDLAVLYQVKVSCGGGSGVIALNDGLMKQFLPDMTEEDLFATAVANAKGTFVVRNMRELILSMMGIPEELVYSDGEDAGLLEVLAEMSDTPDALPMYVLTNKDQHYGAAVLFDEDVLHNLAEELGANLILLPSSVHELIAIPVNEETCLMDPTDMRDMVMEVNGSVLSEEEYLADSVYMYDMERREVSRVADC